MAAIEERVTRLEERLEGVREDIREIRSYSADNRKRIHDLEGDRAAVKALAETIQQLPGQLRGIARAAAVEALEDTNARHRGILSVRVQIAAAAVAFIVMACTIVTTVVTVTGGHP